MAQPDWEQIKQYILGRLERELPLDLTYHAITHTRDDVLPAAERLAALAGIAGADLFLLRVAAVYHDVGYISQYFTNEPVAVHIAHDSLPGFGLSVAQIEAVADLIMATQMPQTPHNFLEELLCDADLDSLGRDDYWATSLALHAELAQHGMAITMRDWVERQYKFLSGHTYFTEVARTLRNAKKAENIAMLQARLAAFSS